MTADSQSVRHHLATVLASPQFSAAPRLARFLTFIVEAALDGRSAEIKESLIAVEAYGRAADYDPRVDSTVRVEAWRLRAKLREFYETASQNAPIVIELPKGRYVPVFRQSRSAEAKNPAASLRRSALIAAALGVLVMAGTIVTLTHSRGVRADAPDAEILNVYNRAWRLLREWRNEDGRIVSVEESVRRSIPLFQQVVQRSLRFARGWASLAEASEFAWELDRHRPSRLLTDARSAARRAVEVDPQSPEAYAALCSILFFRDWNLTGADRACSRAVELNPRDVATHRRLADLRRVQGRWSEAAEQLERAIALVPSDAGLRLRKARLYYDAGQYERAAEEARTSLDINIGRQQPSWTRALLLWGLCHESLGEIDEAEASYRAALAQRRGDTWNQGALGHLLAKSGRTAEAEQVRSEMEGRAAQGEDQNFALALVYVGLGQHVKALEFLERGFDRREDTMLYLGLEQRFQPIRNDPRFQALLDEVRGSVRNREDRSSLMLTAAGKIPVLFF
jgi:tetratricopeptide (TPR) repeat protein